MTKAALVGTDRLPNSDDEQVRLEALEEMRKQFPLQGAWVRLVGASWSVGILDDDDGHLAKRVTLGKSIKSWRVAVQRARERVVKAEQRHRHPVKKKRANGKHEQLPLPFDPC